MTAITKVLVANRGEIAARIIRTCTAMDIATVAVFSDPDADLPYVAAADEAVPLPGAAPADTYLRADAIIAAARATSADAVHPGYGFLSENADFARACAAAGLTFVGPSPEAIAQMGSKVAAKQLMASADVPVLPGATISAEDDQDPRRLHEMAARIGYPLLVKAAFGGGGRGMRIVHDEEALAAAVASARREAASAFGDGMVFLERLVESPRHIEVQILGDHAGNVAHLFERECSIQRRYQKIVEEAPSTAIDDGLRDRLCQAAVAAGKAIGYVGAGTVEFVLAPSGDFYFLEVNTRLQVEHPVTELVTGVDLVRLQLEIAAGKPLPDEVLAARIDGHAIECRLYAEDVPGGYLPVSGQIRTLEIDPAPGLRVDAGFASGTTVSTFYDSMLAKVIAWGPTRDQARTTLAAALSRARLHGIVTNRDLLVAILREHDFATGAIHTGYLDLHPPARLCAGPDAARRPVALRTHLLAAALAAQAERRQNAPVLGSLPSGWRNNPSGMQSVTFEADGQQHTVEYQFAQSGLTARVDGGVVDGLRLRAAQPDLADFDLGGVRRRVRITRADGTHYADSALGAHALREVERFPDPSDATPPGSLLAPMPGTVVRVEVAVGDRVDAGDRILVMEAMKMEHAITAPAPGTVTEIRVGVGQQVDGGSLLAVLADERVLADE
jgi:propionyl-CoA carboxylase alpha chain